MGVPKFFLWIKNQNYRGVLNKYLPKNVSSFSLDLNSVLHTVAQQVYSYGSGYDEKRSKLVAQSDPLLLEAEYHQVLASKLTELIRQVNPQDVLTLAVDGVAPQAKIAQQRQRRYRASFESSNSGHTPSVFDSTCISPGTEFMMRLDVFLQKYLVSMSNIFPPKVIYSSHNKASEGEHEIFSLIRKGEINNNVSDGNNNEGAHVIYGMDADLIMLSLVSNLSNIYLMREDIYNVVNIDNLRLSIKENYKINQESIISDFVLLMFLIGNDFLPHVVSLNDLDVAISTMMSVYVQINLPLTLEGEIVWENFLIYLEALANLEPQLLEAESKREVKHVSRMMETATTRTSTIENNGVVVNKSSFNGDIFRSAWYANALNAKVPDIFSTLMPSINFNKVDSGKLTDMIRQYITGLAWTLRYYVKGMESVNNNYVYRYHYAPLLKDVVTILKKFKPSKESYYENKDNLVINPVHQLLAIIPYKSRNLLPAETLQLTSNSVIADLFIENAIIERDGMNTDWQGVILVDFVNMSRIIEAVNNACVFTDKRIRQFSAVNNIILRKNKEIEKVRLGARDFKEFLKHQAQQNNTGRGYNNGNNPDNRGDNRNNRNIGRGDNRYDNRNNRAVDNRYNDNRDIGRGYRDNREDNRDRDSGRGRGYNRDNYDNKNIETYDRRDNTRNTGRGRGYNNRYDRDNAGNKQYSGRGRGYNYNNRNDNKPQNRKQDNIERNEGVQPIALMPVKPKIHVPVAKQTQMFEL